MKKILYAMLFLSLTVYVSNGQSVEKTNKAKYVFLFIGDGMGLNQVYLAELYKASLDGNIGNSPLNLSQLPIQSYMTTYSANSNITCSSAAATAMATGHKTDNGVVCKNPELTIKYKTIAEKAKASGYSVGILSSVAIDHATPACFYAHQDSRNMYYEISLELPESRFDYFGGGGFHYPKGKGDTLPDAFENAASMGYTITKNQTEYESITTNDELVFAMNPQLYGGGEFYWTIDNKEGALSLAEFTKKGIDLMKDDEGFFMMVEGGKIDWACHANDAATCIHETLAFDDAVAEALKFYNQHPDETLIIVTADHETGGMGTGTNINNDLGGMQIEKLQYQKTSAQEFERKLSLLKSENKKASFEKVMEQISFNFGLGDKNKGLAISTEELSWLKQAYDKEFNGNSKVDPDKDYLSKSEEMSLTSRVIYLLNQKVGIGWTTGHHTAIPVPIRAIGVGQEKFKKYIDNTDIPKTIELLMEL